MAEGVTKDAESPGRIAKGLGDRVGGMPFDKKSAEGLVLTLFGFAQQSLDKAQRLAQGLKVIFGLFGVAASLSCRGGRAETRAQHPGRLEVEREQEPL